MSKKKEFSDPFCERVRQDMRRLQHWFQGFEAAGGQIPDCLRSFSCLHDGIRIIQAYKDIKDD